MSRWNEQQIFVDLLQWAGLAALVSLVWWMIFR